MQEKFKELTEKCRSAISNFTEEEGEVCNLFHFYNQSFIDNKNKLLWSNLLLATTQNREIKQGQWRRHKKRNVKITFAISEKIHDVLHSLGAALKFRKRKDF